MRNSVAASAAPDRGRLPRQAWHVLDVIPVDSLIAPSDYEHEFTLRQFTILPAGAAQKFKITQFEKINVIRSRDLDSIAFFQSR